MSKAKKTKTDKGGEQLDLIDVHAKNIKPIIQAARLYKKFQAIRLTALKKEVAQKQRVLDLVREAKLKPLANGKIKFKSDHVKISVTPRDALIEVQEETE